MLDEEYVFTHTTEVPGRIFCPHHLSSLGKTPAWKNVEYAATQAATWGVPVGCSEGGAWFHPYRSEEGHAINVKLLEECAKFNYDFCAIVCIDNNEWTIANTWGTELLPAVIAGGLVIQLFLVILALNKAFSQKKKHKS